MITHIVTIPLTPKARLLTSNQRMHWAKKAELTKLWRILGKHYALDLPKHIDRAQVDAYVYKPNKRRYDPANLYPTFKALVDGFTDAGVWEDDDAAHVDGPLMHHGGVDKENPRFEIHIKEIQ